VHTVSSLLSCSFQRRLSRAKHAYSYTTAARQNSRPMSVETLSYVIIIISSSSSSIDVIVIDIIVTDVIVIDVIIIDVIVIDIIISSSSSIDIIIDVIVVDIIVIDIIVIDIIFVVISVVVSFPEYVICLRLSFCLSVSLSVCLSVRLLTTLTIEIVMDVSEQPVCYQCWNTLCRSIASSNAQRLQLLINVYVFVYGFLLCDLEWKLLGWFWWCIACFNSMLDKIDANPLCDACFSALYKYSYLLTYLLTYLCWSAAGRKLQTVYCMPSSVTHRTDIGRCWMFVHCRRACKTSFLFSFYHAACNADAV